MSAHVVHNIPADRGASIRLIRYDGRDTPDGKPYEEWQVVDRSGLTVAMLTPETIVGAARAIDSAIERVVSPPEAARLVIEARMLAERVVGDKAQTLITALADVVERTYKTQGTEPAR